MGSWKSNTHCMDQYMRTFFDIGESITDYPPRPGVFDLSLSKQLCEDACYRSQDCFSADLYHRPVSKYNKKYRLSVCYLIEKFCSEERLQHYSPKADNSSYYHFRKGNLEIRLFYK